MKRVACFVFAFAALSFVSRAYGAACSEPAKVEIKKGMKVISALAGPNWQVAKVESIKGGKFTVKDAEGGLGSLGPKEVIAHPDVLYHGSVPCFKSGDKVIAKAQGDIWRTATVSKVDGDKIEVKFYDKTKKTLKGNELVRQPM